MKSLRFMLWQSEELWMKYLEKTVTVNYNKIFARCERNSLLFEIIKRLSIKIQLIDQPGVCTRPQDLARHKINAACRRASGLISLSMRPARSIGECKMRGRERKRERKKVRKKNKIVDSTAIVPILDHDISCCLPSSCITRNLRLVCYFYIRHGHALAGTRGHQIYPKHHPTMKFFNFPTRTESAILAYCDLPRFFSFP